MQWKPNATVAALAKNDGRFLLVEESIDGRLVFNQPAGHLEKTESLIDAIKREVMEETAWQFEPEFLTGIYLYPKPNDNEITYLRFCFYGQCTQHYPDRPLDDGIVSAVWLSQQQIQQQMARLRSPMVLTCIEDFLSGKRYPLDILHYYEDE